MKKLRLPCAHCLRYGFPSRRALVIRGEQDVTNEVKVYLNDGVRELKTNINREQAEALVAHLTAVFGLSSPETTPVNPYVIYED